jgi:parallel beta-helix repeat protein
VTWRGNWVHANIGPGIRSDGNVHNVLVEGNTVENNTGPGIDHEISWDGTIRNNTVRNNGSEDIGQSCWHGYASQIHVNTSQNVQIYGNTVSSAAGANGICLVDATRPQTAPFPTSLANISVHDNTIKLSGTAQAGLVGNNDNNVTFDHDAYFVSATGRSQWDWYDKYPLTWAAFRARGQEPHGTVTTFK